MSRDIFVDPLPQESFGDIVALPPPPGPAPPKVSRIIWMDPMTYSCLFWIFF